MNELGPEENHIQISLLKSGFLAWPELWADATQQGQCSPSAKAV